MKTVLSGNGRQSTENTKLKPTAIVTALDKFYNLWYYVAKGWCNDDIILRAETQREKEY